MHYDVPRANREHFMLDGPHNLDLGVAAPLTGEAIMSALKTGVFGNPCTEHGLKRGLQVLNARLKAYYSRRRISRHAPLKLTSLQFTNLQSRGHLAGKGNQIKHMVPFVTQHVLKRGCAGRLRHLRRA